MPVLGLPIHLVLKRLPLSKVLLVVPSALNAVDLRHAGFPRGLPTLPLLVK
jgi:hypothetical protein